MSARIEWKQASPSHRREDSSCYPLTHNVGLVGLGDASVELSTSLSQNNGEEGAREREPGKPNKSQGSQRRSDKQSRKGK